MAVWGCVAESVDFNRDIRPILSEHCYRCHGPDRNARKAGLRLDVATEAEMVRKGRRAVHPGHPESSELVRRVGTADESEIMPPPEIGKPLTTAQKAVLARWIQEGAVYAPHWSLAPLHRPALPPETAATGASSHPVDLFIRARLVAEGSVPSKEADRAALLRRVTLDLTGLPPTPQETVAFVRSRDPEAYAKAVDRMLASPQFAERMTVHWLDLVRYADSIGYHGDVAFSVWPYRDYVLESFRRNLPFDQFTREQLAGDLLPNATPQQRVASGYNRLNRISTEGGAQDKEYLAKYASDRVRTTSTIWLGATIGCAECHDHKYDPYTTRDFYRFSAYFSDLKEKGFYDDGFSKNDWGPKELLTTRAQRRELDALDGRIRKLQAAMEAVPETRLQESMRRWEERVGVLDDAGLLEWRTLKPTSASTLHGAVLTIATNRTVSAGGPNPDRETYVVRFKPGPGPVTAIRLETLTDEAYAGNRVARSGTTFHITEVELTLEAGVGKGGRRLRVGSVTADFEGEGHPARAMADGDPRTSWAITVGHSREHQAVFRFPSPVLFGVDDTLVFTLRHDSDQAQTTVGKFRVSASAMELPGPEKWGMPESALKILRTPREERTEEQRRNLLKEFRKTAPETAELRAELSRLNERRLRLLGDIPTSLVTESVKPRVTRVLPRGNWMDESGEEVTPAVPRVFGVGESAGRATRLDLARWLTSDSNPVAARAFVNRVWRLFYGVGLSKTLEDLGSQGEWPTHPELLDWLAAEFVHPEFRCPGEEAPPHRWDMRHLVRVIVTSATYRQSSDPRPELESKDPYNRLLARQNRLRLDAEQVRDNALAISGLLVNQWGGPSVHPYQPRGYYSPLNFPKREYVESTGSGLYRRGLYTHWQRTFLHPSLAAFDAPAREECTVNRTPSNTPLQALVLLNDTTYVEAARVFAERLLREHRRERADRPVLASALMRAVGRTAEAAELAALERLLAAERVAYARVPEDARKLVSAGKAPVAADLDAVEWAAWTSVARAVLNLNETITRP